MRLSKAGLVVSPLNCLSGYIEACKVLLDHPLMNRKLLQARLPDGRTALHIAAMKGNVSITKSFLKRGRIEQNDQLIQLKRLKTMFYLVLGIDSADCEIKFSPLQNAITLGQVEIVRIFLHYCGCQKSHKDFDQSISYLSLIAIYSSECERIDISNIKPLVNLILAAGSSFTQVSTKNMTCWHYFAMFPDHLNKMEFSNYFPSGGEGSYHRW